MWHCFQTKMRETKQYKFFNMDENEMNLWILLWQWLIFIVSYRNTKFNDFMWTWPVYFFIKLYIRVRHIVPCILFPWTIKENINIIHNKNQELVLIKIKPIEKFLRLNPLVLYLKKTVHCFLTHQEPTTSELQQHSNSHWLGWFHNFG